MDTKVLNYRIIIEPELNKKTGKKVYVGICPKLGVSDWGKTVEAAIGNIKEAIECHLESMASHKKDIPCSDTDEYLVTTTEVSLPANIHFGFA